MGKAQFGSSLLHERPAFMTFLGQAQFELLLNTIQWGRSFPTIRVNMGLVACFLFFFKV